MPTSSANVSEAARMATLQVRRCQTDQNAVKTMPMPTRIMPPSHQRVTERSALKPRSANHSGPTRPNAISAPSRQGRCSPASRSVNSAIAITNPPVDVT